MSEVYVAMCADILHRGHINILRSASAYGRVIAGLLGDEQAWVNAQTIEVAGGYNI